MAAIWMATAGGVSAGERAPSAGAESVWVQAEDGLFELDPEAGSWSQRASGGSDDLRFAVYSEAGLAWLWDGSTLWVRDRRVSEQFERTAGNLGCESPMLSATPDGYLLASCPRSVGLWSPAGEAAWLWTARASIRSVKATEELVEVELDDGRVGLDPVDGAELEMAADGDVAEVVPATTFAATAIDPRDGSTWMVEGGDLVRDTSDGLEIERHALPSVRPVSAIAVEVRPTPLASAVPPSRPPARERTSVGASRLVAAGVALLPAESSLAGTVTFDDGRAAAGDSLTVLSPPVPAASVATNGAFSTPPFETPPSALAPVIARSATPFGVARGASRVAVSAGATSTGVNLPVAHACPSGFSSGLFPAGDLNGDVRAMVVFDDGSGPALFVGGTFTTARGTTVNRVAKWNGTSWQTLGSGLTASSSASVDALVIFNDGSGSRLYAGGNFTASGSSTVRYVARWTGSAWAQVGGSLGNQVLALAVHDAGSGAVLYAGGLFTTSGGTTYNRIARLSGSAWVAVGSGFNGTVRSLASFNSGTGPRLVAGGSFTSAGSVAVNRIAQWNGSSWSALGTGLTGGTTIQVNALRVHTDEWGTALYAGGQFTTAGGLTARHVARWSGSAWSVLDTGLAASVNALASFDDGRRPSLFAAGSFTSASGTVFNRIARWNGSRWWPVDAGLDGAALTAASGTVGGRSALFVGGQFSKANGLASTRVSQVTRAVSCADATPPFLAFASPAAGTAVGDDRPLLKLGASDSGTGLNLASISLTRDGQPVGASCSFADPVFTCQPTAPLAAGAVDLVARIADVQGNLSDPAGLTFSISESVAPVVTFVAPVDGTVQQSRRPLVRLTYSDTGSGVDPSTLSLTFDGLATAVECRKASAEALCVPTADLAEGPITARATVRDLQGNLSLEAVRNFAVSWPPSRTTFVGRLLLADGSTATGATLRLEEDAQRWATAAGDGTVTMEEVELIDAEPVRLIGSHTPPNSNRTSLAFIGPLTPNLGGVTDLGTIVLQLDCDSFFEPVDWLGVEANLEWEPAATAVFDDGSGPALYAAGRFNSSDSGPAGRIVRWSSAGWQEVGGGVGFDVQPEIHALAVWDDGSGPALYAGGKFTTAGGKPASFLARWDGTSWTEVGGGVNGAVTGLAVVDRGGGPVLIAVGDFTRAGTRTTWVGGDRSVAANHVAQWNGSAWSAVGSGISDSAQSSPYRVAVLRQGATTALYAWKYFSLWRLDGATWTSLAAPGSYGIGALTSYDDGSGAHLVAASDGIFRLDGTSWTRLLASSLVRSIAVVHAAAGDQLWVSGDFASAANPGGDETRRWTGSAWSGRLGDTGFLSVAPFPGDPQLLLTVDPDFYSPGTQLFRWSGTAWEPWLAAGDTEGTISTLAQVATPQGDVVLFAGPTRAGGVALGGAIGRWNGVTVAPAGAGLTGGGSKVLEVSDGIRRHVYGLAGSAGEVAEWNGTGWSRLGEAIGTEITSVAWADLGAGPQLFAAGNGVYRWNGWFWSAIGGPAAVQALAGYQGLLWAAGGFTSVNGASAGRLASWNGSAWTPVGTSSTGGLNGQVRALREFEGLLYLAGDFTAAGASTSVQYGLAAWNGAFFTDGVAPACGYLRNRFLSATTASTPLSSRLHSLEVFDDGRARSLIVGGDFAAECTSQSGNSGRVLGSPNLNLGTGVDGPPVRALAPGRRAGGPALLVGGAFGTVSGMPSARLAIWHKSPAWGSCSPWGQAPVITITSPPGLLTRSAAVTVEGHLDEPAVLKRDGVEIPLDPSLAFRFDSGPLVEGPNRVVLVARDRMGQSAQRELYLVRDTMAPEVRVVTPESSTRSFSRQPAIDLAFIESGSGLESGSLVVTLRGQTLPAASCVIAGLRARCLPPAPLSDGVVEIRATVADRAGNVSAQASASFIVEAAAGQGVLLAGTVHFEDGTPASGARVRALGAGGSAQTGADGRYSLALTEVPNDRALTLVADGVRNGARLTGARAGVVPLPGGQVSVPVITLAAACDPAIVADLSGSVGLAGRVLALAVFDDGTGPALFAGGSSLLVDGATTHHLVKWTGTEWRAVQPGPTAPVRALEVFDDGRGLALYVGGEFAAVGSIMARGLARWNGAAWEEVGGGLSRDVYFNLSCLAASATVFALRAFDDGSGPALYVGGDLARAGGVGSDLVARWNGQTWQSMGTPPANCPAGRAVYALTPFAPAGTARLHVAGAFSQIGGVPAWNIARREGSGWVDLDGGVGRLSGTTPIAAMVTSMSVFDGGTGPELYAAGLFTRAGRATEAIASVARWNGERWRGVGEGLAITFTSMSLPTGVQALATWASPAGPRLVAAGSFRSSGELALDGVTAWDGGTWAPLAGGIGDAGEGGMAMASHLGRLVVAGGFRAAGGLGANRIAAWDGRFWSVFGSGLDDAVEALALFDDGTGPALVAGGRFLSAGNVPLNHLGKWTGAGWEPLGAGTDGDVLALETATEAGVPVLYAGGRFARAGDVAALSVARWSAGTWSALGEGLAGGTSPTDPRAVHALETVVEAGSPVLYAGGEFQSSGSTEARNIARWSSGRWSPVGAGLGGPVRALLHTTVGGTPRLIAGGDFTSDYDGTSLPAIGAWNGTAWASLGSGMTQSGGASVRALSEWPETAGNVVVAAGRFTAAGGVAAAGIARWNGTAWSALASGFGTGAAEALAPWDDLVGRTLTVGGASALLKGWSGSAWSTPLPASSAGSQITALQPVEARDGSALYLGGSFPQLGTQRVSNLAALRRPAFCGDTSGPEIVITAPAAGTWIRQTRPAIVLTMSDARSGVDPGTLGIRVDGQPLSVTCDRSAEAATCYPDLPLAQGQRQLTVSVSDAVGNSGSQSVAFSVDSVAPAVEFFDPPPGSTLTTSTPTIRFRFVEVGSGVVPESVVIVPTGTVAFGVECSYDTLGGECVASAPIADSHIALRVSVADGAGNRSSSGEAAFVVDTRPPAVSIVAPADGATVFRLPDSVELGLDEAGSGVDPESVSATLDGSPLALACVVLESTARCELASPIAAGSHALSVWVTDRAGQASAPAAVSFQVLVDATAPALAFALPAAGATFDLRGAPFVLTWSDDLSGVDAGTLSVLANGKPLDISCSPIAGGTNCQARQVLSGGVTLAARVRDLAGNTSAVATVSFTSSGGPVDTTEPVIIVLRPSSGSFTNRSPVEIRGAVSEVASLTVGGRPVALLDERRFRAEQILEEGANTVQLRATDPAGNTGELAIEITLDTVPPAGLVDSLVSLAPSVDGRASFAGMAGSVLGPEPGLRVLVRDRRSGAAVYAPLATDGSFSGLARALPGDEVEIMTVDLAGNESSPLTRTATGVDPLPAVPDPSRTGTDLGSPFCRKHSFLWSGPTPIQYGVAEGAIDCARVVVLRGRVVDAQAGPVAGVRITAPRDPAVGVGISRADGAFDFAVSGGGPVTLELAKPGFLEVQRTLTVGWQELRLLEDVVLTRRSSVASSLDLASLEEVQIARGELVSDVEGARRATLLFPRGTTAAAVLAGGATQALPQVTVRATEYTVGAAPEGALPGPLPPLMDPTYVVELGVDEAEAIGAERVRFDPPLPFYLEDFLGAPTGVEVAAASWNRLTSRWDAENDGRVIEIVGEVGGAALIDLDGTGDASSEEELAALGMTLAERRALARIYQPGQKLIRGRIEHFTPWYFGFGMLGQSVAGGPPPDLPLPFVRDERRSESPHLGQFGGTVDAENLTLLQSLPLMGSSLSLVYASDRVPGRRSAYRLEIPATGATVPVGLVGVEVEVESAGRREVQILAPLPGQTTTVDWDGEDAHGRAADGPESWRVRVSYLYQDQHAVNSEEGPRSFELPMGRRIESDARGLQRYSRESVGRFPALNGKKAFGLGGWGLDILHRFDPMSRTVFFGDGSRRLWSAGPESKQVLLRVAGNGVPGSDGDGGPARQAQLSGPSGVSVNRRGELLIADTGNCRIRKVDLDGAISTVAGTSCAGGGGASTGDGGPASQARLDRPSKAIETPDGAVWIAELESGRVRRVDPKTGAISTAATFSGAGCDARVVDLDADRAGTVFAAVASDEPELGGAPCRGLWTISGSGAAVYLEPEPMLLRFPLLNGLDVLDDGRIALVQGGGLQETTRAGTWAKTLPGTGSGVLFWPVMPENGPGVIFRGDGQPALYEWTRYFWPTQLAVANDGTTYLADTGNGRVRVVRPDGLVDTLVGGGSALLAGDGYRPSQAALARPFGVALSPDDSTLFVSDHAGDTVWKVTFPAVEEKGVYSIPASDGSALYVFDADGYHLRTESTKTRRVLWRFTYQSYPGSGSEEPDRKLVTEIEDDYGNVTRIERAEDGSPLAVVAPFGQRTTMALDGTGFLSGVSRTVGGRAENVVFAGRPDGLIDSIREPNGGLYQYGWDALGRLASVRNPGAGSLSLASTGDDAHGRKVDLTSAMSRSGSMELQFLPKAEVRWTGVDSAGLRATRSRRKDGSIAATLPGGMSAELETVPDRLYAPFVDDWSSLTLTLSPARSLALGHSAVAVADPSDELRTLQRTDQVSVNGRTSAVHYDGQGRTVTSVSPAGRTAVGHLDERNRVTSADIPGVAEPVHRFFDALGRLERVEQGTGPALRRTSYAYDPGSGYLASVTDPLGRTTRFEHDEAGRVTKQILPDLREIGFRHDLAGNVLEVTPPARPAHAFAYTPIDQVSSYTPPEVGFAPRHTAYAYNADGQVTTVTRPDGQEVRTVYEPSGRPDFVTLPTGVVDYAYDAATGRVSEVSAPGGFHAAFGYDGPLLTSIATSSPVAGSVGFSYDADLRLASQSISGGPAIPFAYDADGLLVQAGGLTLTRNGASGALEATTLGTTSDTRTLTGFAELDVYTAKIGGETLFSYDLDRDVAGRITKKTETLGGVTRVWEYLYTPERGWLKEVKRDHVVVESYTYDDNGNRTAWSNSWGVAAATYDAQDRMLSAGPGTYLYTPNGDLREKTAGPETTVYTYDVRGALTGVDLPNGVGITYLVDAEGRRIGKRVNGVLTQGWLYAGGLAPVAELSPSGEVTATFVYATRGNVPDLILRDGTAYRLFTDPLGSVRLVVESTTGAIAQQIDYDTFGRITYDSNPGFQPFGFAGGIYDYQTGLTRFGARDYDAEVGRWTSKDPIRFAGGSAGLYEYVGNDPVNLADPDGTHPLLIPVLGLAGLGYAVELYQQDPERAEEFLREDLPELLTLAALTEVVGVLADTALSKIENLAKGISAAETSIPRVRVSRSRHLESAQVIEDALAQGKPTRLTIARTGSAVRRREALQGTKAVSGLDRDEYPPAMFLEGGRGAFVRPISRSDNRGAGACIGAQCRPYPDGTQVLIEVIE